MADMNITETLRVNWHTIIYISNDSNKQFILFKSFFMGSNSLLVITATNHKHFQ